MLLIAVDLYVETVFLHFIFEFVHLHSFYINEMIEILYP